MKFTAVAILATYAAAINMEADAAVDAKADVKDQVVYEPNQWVGAYAKTTDITYGHGHPHGYGARAHQPWGYRAQPWGHRAQPWGYRAQPYQQPAKEVSWRKDYGLRSTRQQYSPFNGWVAEDHPNMRLLKLLGRAPQYDVNTWEKASCIDEDWGQPEYKEAAPAYDCKDGNCAPYAQAYDCKDGSCAHVEDCRECGTIALTDGACGSAIADCKDGKCKDASCEWSSIDGKCGWGVPSQIPARQEKERRAWWQPTTTVRPGAYRATYKAMPAYADALPHYGRRWGY